jgi:hypothetical protein
MINSSSEAEEAVERAVETSRMEGNSIFYELTRQLLLLGTIVVSLSPAVAFTDAAFPTISRNPWPYLAALVFALSSLGFGIWQLFYDWRFFKGHAEANGLQAAYDKGVELTVKQKMHVNRYKSAEATGLMASGDLRVYFQIASLALAFIFLVATAGQVLFSGTDPGSSSRPGLHGHYIRYRQL